MLAPCIICFLKTINYKEVQKYLFGINGLILLYTTSRSTTIYSTSTCLTPSVCQRHIADLKTSSSRSVCVCVCVCGQPTRRSPYTGSSFTTRSSLRPTAHQSLRAHARPRAAWAEFRARPPPLYPAGDSQREIQSVDMFKPNKFISDFKFQITLIVIREHGT